MKHGVEEIVIMTPEELDAEYLAGREYYTRGYAKPRCPIAAFGWEAAQDDATIFIGKPQFFIRS